MPERVEKLKRLIKARYGYDVSLIECHPVEQTLEDGTTFADTVHEFAIKSGSRWERCFGWLAYPEDADRTSDWPCECFAVPTFAMITDARAAVRWVHGLPLR